MRICIIGAGYVGLVSGACFADSGHEVTCVDFDAAKVAAINAGRAPIHEQGLDDILARVVGTRLRATTSLADSVLAADAIFICVGTPFDGERIDLRQVLAAAREVGAALGSDPAPRYRIVVVKSTVIPGTTDGPVREALEQGSGKPAGEAYGLCMNPEFLTEGTAVADFSRPDRIVLGACDGKAQDVLAQLYTAWPDVPKVRCNTRTAEMIKYASNAVLATMISFSNELARLCSSLGGVDVADVLGGVHLATYFTQRRTDGEAVTAPITSFLGAGCGFGGSCLPKDVSAIVAQGRERGVAMPLLAAVLEVNRNQPAQMLALARKEVGGALSGKRVAVLGLAFKPDTDDVRESPAFPILAQLAEEGAIVRAYDPIARPPEARLAGAVQVGSLAEAVTDADVVLLVTRWDEFRALPGMLAPRGVPLVDGRRMLDPAAFPRYAGIGR